MYDFDDDKPRVPKFDDEFTFTVSTSVIPDEVAVCLSMHAEQVSGGIRARRRGRVFLGPFGLEIVSQEAALRDAQVHTSHRTAILSRAQDLATGGAGQYRLAVYSPTTELNGGTADEAWNDVVELSMDNAFDTQRRRGIAPTSREVVAV